MADLQSLIQAFQALGIGAGSVGSPTTGAVPAVPAGGGSDPKAQLMQLLNGTSTPAPTGGSGGMAQAITQSMGSDPRSRFAAQMPNDAGSVPVRGGSNYNTGAEPMGMAGPATDGDLLAMADANQNVRGRLRKQNMTGDMTGFSDDVAPIDDIRQTPKPMSTEDELADVQKRMGSDPSDDGNFPTRAEIKALNSGEMTPQEFDKKWGKGAAAEMMDEPEAVKDDEGDHEYR